MPPYFAELDRNEHDPEDLPGEATDTLVLQLHEEVPADFETAYLHFGPDQ